MCAMVSITKRECDVPANIIKEMDELYEKLAQSDSSSLLKKFLTREIYEGLKLKETPYGSTLMDCIRSGLHNHDSGIGVYAPDVEAYTTFSDLFDPIIENYHGGFKKTATHPEKDWGDTTEFENIDPNNKYVISTRIRTGRNIQGFPLNPIMQEEHYKQIEKNVSSVLSSLEGDLKGTYYPLTGMDKATQQKLIDDHYLFKEGDRFLEAANANRYWPTGRGIFLNENKTFLVWINEEDHMRIISMQEGGDIKEVYNRLITAVDELEKHVKFSRHPRLGYLTFCPSNLGTAIRASVHIKLPNLGKNKEELDKIAEQYKLQVRGTRGEHTEAEEGVYDVSNKWRLGITEYQAVSYLHHGIIKLIQQEEKS